ncbi:hypothetical protein SCA6_017011 [Theobroma cacao]
MGLTIYPPPTTKPSKSQPRKQIIKKKTQRNSHCYSQNSLSNQMERAPTTSGKDSTFLSSNSPALH